MAEEPFSERLKRLEDRIAAARAGRAEPARGHQRRVHPGLARLAHGDRAGGGDGAGAGDRLRAGRALRHPAGVPGGVRPPGLRRRRADDAPHRRGGAEQARRSRPDGRQRTRTGGRRGAMADEAGGSGFNIHPMEQFEVHPLFGGDVVHWYTPTNATLWMALTVIAASLLMIAGSRGRALVPSRMQSVAELIYGFVLQDDRGRHRQGRRQVLPLHHDPLPLHPLRQPARAHPRPLRLDLAHRRHRDPRARRLHHRHGDRLHEARRALPEPLLGGERADGGAPHRARASSRSSRTSCARSATPSDLPAT